MQLNKSTVVITANLQLSRRELQLMHNLLAYDIKNYIKTITPNSYENGVSTKELTDFVTELSLSLSKMIQSVDAALIQAKMGD